MRFFISIKILLLLSAVIALQNSHEFSFNNGVIIAGNNGTKDSSLKQIFKNDFLIGTALNASQIEEKEPNAADANTNSNSMPLLRKTL